MTHAPGDSSASTPVRALGSLDPAGYRLLRDVGSSYRDGAEDDVLRLITEADDVRSFSDHLVVRAEGWAQRYHTDPSRANIVRGLDLPPGARVLEIGAGCGAITRYLGEQCAVVDALEPVPSRAASAAARTRDLPGVQVLVGELDDVPDAATYDVVVVVGVLEYVGGGSPDRAPYLDFLSAIRFRLVEGGTLVLAIENKLGVKYLVGSPEDHTNRVFDSLEDYPAGGHARTFTRRELETLLGEAGLLPATRVAFPDYKLTRAVLGPIEGEAASLLHRIPRFPSPDWRGARPKLADEASLWRTLVQAGLAMEFGNSFLVLAGNGSASRLWPEQRLAVFYSGDRRTELSTATSVETEGGGVVFRRTGLAADGGEGGSTALIESVTPFVPGRDLTEIIATDGLDAAVPLIKQWLLLVDDATAEHGSPSVDLVPHNLVIDAAGQARVIDIELVDESMARDQVVRRGLFWLGSRVTRSAPPQRWAPAKTIGDVVLALGELAGLPADSGWLERAISEESVFLAGVRSQPPGLDLEQFAAQIEATLRKLVARRLSTLPLGERLPAQHRRAAADAEKKAAELTRLRRELARAQRAAKQPQATRLGGVSRAAAGKLLPRGTRRRAAVERLRGR